MFTRRDVRYHIFLTKLFRISQNGHHVLKKLGIEAKIIQGDPPNEKSTICEGRLVT
jgi:hypothetical protein